MVSQRSKALWCLSQPLSTYVVEEAGKLLTRSPLPPTIVRSGWFDVLARVSGAFLMPGNVIEQIKEAVRCGTLIATGIRLSPSNSLSPIIIPAEAFSHGKFQVFGDTVIGVAGSYGEVRLIAKSNIPAGLLQERPKQAPRQANIQAIIRNLLESGKLDGLRKQQVATVKRELDEAGIANVGSDKTIERHIRLAIRRNSPK